MKRIEVVNFMVRVILLLSDGSVDRCQDFIIVAGDGLKARS